MLTILLTVSVIYQGHAAEDYGRDFVTAFPENIAYYYPSVLTNVLKITALHANTNFHVIYNGANFITGTLNAGQTQAVYLPSEVEEHQLGQSSKSVRITSSNDITVFSISKRANSVQTNVVQPVTNLGQEYHVPFLNFTELLLMLNDYNVSDWVVSSDSSSQAQTYNYFRVLIINAEDKENTVKVTNEQSGSETSVKLSPFQVLQMKSSDSLMKVTAKANISILLTHPCLDTSLCRCTMVVHQLRPANLLGDSFLVPPSYITNNSRMFSTSDESVELRYGSPPLTGSEMLDAGSSDFLPFYQQLTMGFSNISASQPVSLRLMGVASLMDLIPVSMFSACYLVHVTSVTKSEALLIVETAHVSDVRLDSNTFGSSLEWNDINGTAYSWATVDLFLLMSHVIWHPSSKMAVYVLEKMQTSVEYGGPAISINKEPDPSGCLVSPAILKVSDQSVSWPESRQYCMQKGGQLASPSWAAAQRYMALELTKIGAKGQAWIGLRRSLQTMEWYWQSGQVFSFFNWDSGQPVNPEKGMCVFVKMEPNGSYTWGSARCCSSMKPMCFSPPSYLSLINPFG
ncbi:IgGFc-binding protein-like [Salminus brasiliensis]|uniref:IgGFc-binding protein-like n=1 Tax=Salminus brasiliensis TaxID=930266 RepID=UPI003B833D71